MVYKQIANSSLAMEPERRIISKKLACLDLCYPVFKWVDTLGRKPIPKQVIDKIALRNSKSAVERGTLVNCMGS